MGFQIKICLSVTKEDVYFGFGMKEWMKRSCLHFTPSRIALTENAPEALYLQGLFFCLMQETVRLSRYMI